MTQRHRTVHARRSRWYRKTGEVSITKAREKWRKIPIAERRVILERLREEDQCQKGRSS